MTPLPAQARKPLILLPGLLCDEALWAHQVAHLGDVADTRVARLTEQDSIHDMAASVLADAPDRFALAGLSMGGYVAQEIVRIAPHRVSRLALICTSARPDTPERRKQREMQIAQTRRGRFKGVTPRILSLLVHKEGLDDPVLTQGILDMAMRVGRDAFIRQQTAILGRPDGRDNLARIHCPTLIVVGRQDGLTPVDRSEEMAAGIPDSRLAIIEQCGHTAPMEQPQATTALMWQWLRQE